MENNTQETVQEAVEKSKVVENPQPEVKKEQPLTQIIHQEAVFTLSLNDFSIMKQALAPIVWADALLNVAKDRVMSNPKNLVPVFEKDGVWNKDQNGNITGLKEIKNPEEFWTKNSFLKGDSMKIENGELKTN